MVGGPRLPNVLLRAIQGNEVQNGRKLEKKNNSLATKTSKAKRDSEGKERTEAAPSRRRKRLMVTAKAKKKANKPSNLDKLIQLENSGKLTGEQDLEIERQLAKKLKVKPGGKIPGDEDYLNSLLGLDSGDEEDILSLKDDGIHSEDSLDIVATSEDEEMDEEEDEEVQGESSGDEDEDEAHGQLDSEEEGSFEREGDDVEEIDTDTDGDEGDMEAGTAGFEGEGVEKDDDSAMAPSGKVQVSKEAYVAPHLRGLNDDKKEEQLRVERRVRGLLNRLAESNVESIASDVGSILQSHGRSVVGRFISDDILNACISGPRGNDQYAAVFAAFVTGMATSVGMDFGANFVSSLAHKFEEQYRVGDSLALRNLSLLLAHLYNFSLLASDVLYDLLHRLIDRFQELDVSTVLHLLQSCGIGLRSDDPQSMKDFILAVQKQAEVKRVLASGGEGAGDGFSNRVRFMLDTIVDIKNNNSRKKGTEAGHHYARLKKWLQKLPVESVQLRNVSWLLLIQPDKKGHWWLPQPTSNTSSQHLQGTGLFSAIAQVDVDQHVADTDRLLQLAASQRMNTDIRRSIFFVVMNSEDYVDASEKLLRMKLPGKQDREILRVVVECCLQESAFNPYYALLASKLCALDRNHKFTLQFLIWDHFKRIAEMELRRNANLARFIAQTIGSHCISLSILKVIDFCDPRFMVAKLTVHMRILFEALLLGFSKETVWAVFSRISTPPQLSSLRDGLSLFLHHHVRVHAVTVAETQGQAMGELLVKRCKLAKKALTNSSGLILKK